MRRRKDPNCRRLPVWQCAVLVISLVAFVACGKGAPPTTTWQPKQPPLATQWTAQVTATNPLPEYPRPQLVRADWQNLNGVWEWKPATESEAPPVNGQLAERVLVPFPIESALSGVQRHVDRMWYRRTFTVPNAWNGRRVQLNFGAVDWETAVYVNGQQVGTHRGGYDAFSFDITGQLRRGINELIVGVYAPVDDGGQPIGKQRKAPKNIFYTAASGIWQTVWLEPTPLAHITRLDQTPDVPGQALRLIVHAAGATQSTVQVVVLDGGSEVARVSGAPETELRVPIPNPKLWSPAQPFLYDLKVTLNTGSQVDAVSGYFGMRSIGIGAVGDVTRLLLNGKFVFELGLLDQGYWPDGIYTAPTDEALRFDIQKQKDLGYNLVRKHMKVEPQRWYYWADKLGMLVWQDMPAMKLAEPAPEAKQEFEAELQAVIDDHRSATSIVMWVPFNEGWGEYDPLRITNLVQASDPGRLVDNNSGVNCCGAMDAGNGDVVDWHVYVGPDAPPVLQTRAAVLGEFGGLGLPVAQHQWRLGGHFSYADEPDAAADTDHYLRLIGQLQALMTQQGLNAAVYTQVTDVETELNGLYTYDRAVLKPDLAALKAANQQLIEASRTLNP